MRKAIDVETKKRETERNSIRGDYGALPNVRGLVSPQVFTWPDALTRSVKFAMNFSRSRNGNEELVPFGNE